MNEDFTFNNKYNTDSTDVQQQNVNTAQNGYTQETDNSNIPPQQFRPQPQYSQQSGYQAPQQQYSQQNGYQAPQQQYHQPTQSQPVQQQSGFSQRPFDLGTGTQNNGTYQNNAAYQSNIYQQPQRYAPANGYYSYYYTPSPKELEKTAVKKASSYAGKATLAIFLIMQGLAILAMVIAAACGMIDLIPSEGDPYSGFTPTGYYLYTGMLSLVSIFIPTLILIKTSGSKMEELVPFKRIEGKKLAAIVTGGMAMCMLAQVVATLFGINMSLFGIDIYAGLETETATGVFPFIMDTICTAIIPALVEEFAYRGLVTGVLKKHGDLFAVLGSAFLFGLLHGNLAQIPFAFVVGLVLGYVRVKTDSMIPGILIHFGNNFFAVAMTILSETLSDSMGTIVESIVMIILVVAGFVTISYLAKNHKDFFNIKEETSLLTFGEKIKTFFSSGLIIADIVILSFSAAFYLVAL